MSPFDRQQLASDEAQLHALVRAHLPMEYVEKLIPYARANNEIYPPSKKAKVRTNFLSRAKKGSTLCPATSCMLLVHLHP